METPEVLPTENKKNEPKKTTARPPKMSVEPKEDEKTSAQKDMKNGKSKANSDDACKDKPRNADKENSDDNNDEDNKENPDDDGDNDEDENPDDDDDDDDGDNDEDPDDDDDDDDGDDDEDPDDDDDDDDGDDDEDPDDDDDGETGSGTSGEEDENELIWLTKEETSTKNPFSKPQNIPSPTPKKEKIQGPEKVERTPWQQMIDFIVHGAKGAMIKNGDISIKEQITDKLLLGLGFKSFKEDIMLQQQAKKYWIQRLTGQKTDVSLLNTDKIVKKIKNEETFQQKKQRSQEQVTEHKNFLTRLIGQKQKESVSIQPNQQTENLKSRVINQKTEKQPVPTQPLIQQSHLTVNETKTTSTSIPSTSIPSTSVPTSKPQTTETHGLKEKIGLAVQLTEEKLPLRPDHTINQNELHAERPLTVTELKQKEKKEAEINPTTEQSVQKQQKHDQKDFQNLIIMQQMQIQNNIQNNMQHTVQSKLQNELQLQNLQQQMEFVAAARAAGQQHLHQSRPQHRPIQPFPEELLQPVAPTNNLTPAEKQLIRKDSETFANVVHTLNNLKSNPSESKAPNPKSTDSTSADSTSADPNDQLKNTGMGTSTEVLTNNAIPVDEGAMNQENQHLLNESLSKNR